MRSCCSIVLALVLCVWGVYAQSPAEGAYFLSSDQIEEVADPAHWAERQFLLRQGTDSVRFFRVPMSGLLYKNKSKFALPNLELGGRLRLPLFATHAAAVANKPLGEVVLNERLALTETDSLYARMPDSSIQFLPLASSIGVALVQGPPGTTGIRINSKGMSPVRELPAFFYTHKGVATLFVAEHEGDRPQEVDPYTDEGTFQELRLRFQGTPVFQGLPLPRLDLGDDTGAADLEQLDRALRQNDSLRKELELDLAIYMQAASSALYQPMPQRSYETVADFQARLAFRDTLLERMRLAGRKGAAFRDRERELDSRQLLLNSYRTRLQAERQWGASGAQRALLEKAIHRRFFVRAQSSVGRNVPSWAADPGPDAMWSIGLGASYAHPIRSVLCGEIRLGWQHARWRYHEGIGESSTQSRGGLDLLLGWPVAVAVRSPEPGQVSGVVVQLVAGLGGHWSMTHVYGDASYDSRSEPLVLGLGGLQFHFAAVPLVVEGLYSYGTDGFGDLSLALAVPLPQKLFTVFQGNKI